MAGKIVASTINDDTGVLATQNGMTGIAKAWCNFNGTGTVAIRDSFNVSSITDNGTGDYTVNFTTAMPNANYVVAGQGSEVGTAGTHQIEFGSARTVSAYRFITVNFAGANVDSTYPNIAVFSS
jgi:hypothetical protein